MTDQSNDQTSPGSSPDQGVKTNDAQAPGSGAVEIYDDMAPLTKFLILIVAVVALALVLGFFHDVLWHWFEVHTGTVNESGPYYGFWSGFGSDIGEATLVVGVAAAWRHHNCHVKGCPRLGRAVEGTPYVACPKHHPAHEGKRRGVSLSTIHSAHRQAKEERNKQG